MFRVSKLNIVQIGLKEMYDSDRFSICTVRTICEFCGLVMTKETENAFSLLHCVKFSAMDSETRKWVAGKIDELFTNPDLIKNNFMPNICNAKLVAVSPNFLTEA